MMSTPYKPSSIRRCSAASAQPPTDGWFNDASPPYLCMCPINSRVVRRRGKGPRSRESAPGCRTCSGAGRSTRSRSPRDATMPAGCARVPGAAARASRGPSPSRPDLEACRSGAHRRAFAHHADVNSVQRIVETSRALWSARRPAQIEPILFTPAGRPRQGNDIALAGPLRRSAQNIHELGVTEVRGLLAQPEPHEHLALLSHSRFRENGQPHFRIRQERIPLVHHLDLELPADDDGALLRRAEARYT